MFTFKQWQCGPCDGPKFWGNSCRLHKGHPSDHMVISNGFAIFWHDDGRHKATHPFPMNPINCSFCYTGTQGRHNMKKGEYSLATYILMEGPLVQPTHPICNDCFKNKAHLRRARCGYCGTLRSLLFRENTSMTTSWVCMRPQGDIVFVCRACVDSQKGQPLPKPSFPPYVILSDEEVELLHRCWAMPNWKTLKKMPVLLRQLPE